MMTKSPTQTAGWTGTGFGLKLRSSLPIAGAVQSVDQSQPVDIEIAEGVVGGDGEAFGPYRRANGALVFEAPAVARYRCQAGGIIFERIGNASDALLAEFIVATALPAVMWLRGAIVLHAAAAWLPGAAGAIAIIGPSGSGKSTVLRQLVDVGARLVADDSLCIARTAAGISISGMAGGFRLGWPEREFHPVDPAKALIAAPLIGAVVLNMPRTEHVGFSPMDGVERLHALLNHRHRPRIAKLMGLERRTLAPLADIAAMLPMQGWQRREGAIALAPCEMELLQRGG